MTEDHDARVVARLDLADHATTRDRAAKQAQEPGRDRTGQHALGVLSAAQRALARGDALEHLEHRGGVTQPIELEWMHRHRPGNVGHVWRIHLDTDKTRW